MLCKEHPLIVEWSYETGSNSRIIIENGLGSSDNGIENDKCIYACLIQTCAHKKQLGKHLIDYLVRQI